MLNLLQAILTAGTATRREIFPDLPEWAPGLPRVTKAPCEGTGCGACAAACPTGAIALADDAAGGMVALDRGRCIGCGGCMEACPSGTLVEDRSTQTATRTREALVLTNRPHPALPRPVREEALPFSRSLH